MQQYYKNLYYAERNGPQLALTNGAAGPVAAIQDQDPGNVWNGRGRASKTGRCTRKGCKYLPPSS